MIPLIEILRMKKLRIILSGEFFHLLSSKRSVVVINPIKSLPMSEADAPPASDISWSKDALLLPPLTLKGMPSVVTK